MSGIFNSQHKTPQLHLTVRPKPQKGQQAQRNDISTLVSDRLMSLTLTDYRGFDADQLDIQLNDADGKLALPSRGAILTLGLGWQGEMLTYKGEYIVDEVEHSGAPDSLTIRARSADLRGTIINRHERSFHQTTLGKIIHQIASENKLTPCISQAFETVTIAHLDQTNESSISLLQRLAEQYDAVATVKNGNLIFIKAGEGKTASGKAIPPMLITRQMGDNHHFAIAESENYEGVKVYWHDTKTGKRGEVIWDSHSQIVKVKKATQRKTTKAKRDANGKIIKGKDGKSIKETVYNAGKGREVNEVQGTQIKSDSEAIKTLPHTYASEQYAVNRAKSEFLKLKRGTASFSLTLALGNAELMPEMPVEVQGFKSEIDSSRWIITQATHNLLPDSGFTTQIECELMVEEEKAE